MVSSWNAGSLNGEQVPNKTTTYLTSASNSNKFWWVDHFQQCATMNNQADGVIDIQVDAITFTQRER
jgi:hypothetical protein